MTLKLPAFFLFFLFAAGLQAQCVTWFGGQQSTVDDLSTNDPELWNGAPLFDPLTGSNDLAEAFVGTNITFVDTCQTPLPLRFQLWLDLDGDGATETVVDSDNPLPPGYVLMNGDTVQFDQRQQPFYAYFRFVLDTVRSGDTLRAKVIWTEDDNPGAPQFNVQLPYGKHRIVWMYGVESFEKTMEIRDGLAPTIECGPLFIFIPPPPFTDQVFHASVFLDTLYDNHASGTALELGIRRAGTGTGFPFSAYGNPATTVTFSCYEVAYHTLELWARDVYGNTAVCSTTLIIDLGIQHCDFFGNRVHVRTEKWCEGGAVHPYGAEVLGDTLSTAIPIIPPTFQQAFPSDTFGFAVLPLNDNTYDFRVVFQDSNTELNGLSTYDLIRILRHVQGNQAFTEPHQFVAADADNDREITDDDVEALHALLTGAMDTLPGQQRRQYLPDDFLFPPGDPLSGGIPDTFDLPEIVDANLRFFAIQTGDVDCSEPPTVGPDFPVTATNRNLLAGETAVVTVYAAEATTWLGFQTSVQLHPSVELLNITG
ncbi:MAG: hypothetical protein IT270_06445, partial [Saprospiraceae bacterium]|nr:hypothetical protein [Saprospiraceae bacterium]